MEIAPKPPDKPGGTQSTAQVAKRRATKALRAVQPVQPPTPLSEAEIAELAGHEQIIGAGLQTFVEVGEALARVRDGKLYRGAHATFADYCADRWGISDRQGCRLIAAHAVAELTGPTGPASERVARELAPLVSTPKLLTEVWRKAQYEPLRAGRPVTADDVIAARELTQRRVEHDRESLVRRQERALAGEPQRSYQTEAERREERAGAFEAMGQLHDAVKAVEFAARIVSRDGRYIPDVRECIELDVVAIDLAVGVIKSSLDSDGISDAAIEDLLRGEQ